MSHNLKKSVRTDQIDLTDFSRMLNQFQTSIHAFKVEAELNMKKLLELLPSGSGLDQGVKFAWSESKPNRLVFIFAFHHMNTVGYYSGWSHHKLIITPCFMTGYKMTITGRDKNKIKDDLYDLFEEVFFY